MNSINNLKINRLLGSGLSGEVFLAENSEGLYALKFLKISPGPLSKNESIRSFKEEFSILKNLSHPHIAQIHNFGYDEKTERYFYSSEYIEGKNLYDASQDMSCETLEKLFVQTLRALEYLHSRAIFHFDLKPQNILVKTPSSADALIKLIDFGLAGYKPKGNIVGTPAYIAPEIILGESPDARADLYSLGIVFYECLTKQNPFRTKSISETFKLQQSLKVPPPSELRKEIPEYLDQVILKLLQKNPQNRYSHAGAVIQEINQLSGKNYAIETSDTLLAYLPGEGIFIDRKKEMEDFTKIFQEFSKSTHTLYKRNIFLTGVAGLGKTRLLKELRFHAQLHDAKVFLYHDQIPSDINAPLVLIADNIEQNTLQKLSIFSDSFTHSLIMILAGQEHLKPPADYLVWKLSPFGIQEVKDYLVALTGLKKPPDFLMEEITKRSQGNPLFISELIKKLIQKNLLLDKSGRWSANAYEDFEINFSQIEIPKTIHDFLKKEYEAFSPQEQEILKIFTIWKNSLGLIELEKLSQTPNISEIIHHLLENGILNKNEKNQSYDFNNPQLREVVLELMPETEKQKIHQQLAIAIKTDPANHKNYLYHFSRSAFTHETLEALLNLGKLLMQEGNTQEAKQNFELAYHRKNISDLERMEIGLLWGDALLKNSETESAGKLFENIREELKKIKLSPENMPAKVEVLEKLGAVYLKKQEPGIAREIFSSALTLLEEHNYSKVKPLIIQNYMARAKLAEGHQDEALEIFLKTQEIWKNDLNEIEKKQVLNNDLATVYQLKQNQLKAFEQFEKDLDFYESIPHHYLVARTHYHLAEVSTALKKTESTVKHYKSCIEISKNQHFYDLLLRAYNGLGNLLNIHKDYHNSILYYERALAISIKIQDLNSQAAISTNLGILYNENSKTDLAFPQVYQAIFLLEKIRNKTAFQIYFLIRAKIEMGDILRKLKKFEEARDYIKEALSLIEEHPHQDNQLFWAHANLAKLYSDQDRKEKAMKEYEESKSLSSPEDSDQQKELNLIRKMLGEENSAPPQKTHLENKTTNLETPSEEGNELQKAYEYIFQLNQFLNTEHNLDFLLKTILNYALELSGAERALILLLNANEELEIKSSINMEISANLSEISSNIAQKVLKSGEYLETDDATDDARFNEYESVLILKLRSILCLPIHSRNRTVGVLYLDNRYRPGAFKKSNLKVLQAFCDQAGIAIENTKLINQYDQVQKQLREKLAKAEDEASTYQAILKEESINIPTKYSYEKIIAKSKAMYNIFKMLDKITETQLSVFIHGETGTGKELIAKALHYNNKIRNEKRFVALNCGAIPANIMESEMFGHKAGSFTGAMKDKKGLFAEANGGTLFLDEIAELDLNLQVKLLRVLEEGEYTPVGETKSFHCDVRIVAASHKNLELLVKEGKFREDLFYRICQIKIDLPPLRDRKEDIPLLAEKFIEIYRQEHGIEKKLKIAPSFIKKMLEYDWPGNVRELENVISVTTALAENNELTYDSLPGTYGIRRALENKSDSLPGQAKASENLTRKVSIDGSNHYDPKISWKEYEKLIVAKAYQGQGSNPAKAAEVLDVSVATFYKRIKDYDLNNSHNPVYQHPFQYNPAFTLQDYVKKVFHAAQEYSDQHPYTAIKWLGVSQGYYYKILKEK